MNIIVIFSLLAIGLFAGITSGLVGIGAGVLIVPALTYFLKYNQLQAQGTSLGLLLLPIGLLAVYNYYDEGLIDFKAVGLMAVSFLIGGWIGSKISLGLPEDVLKKIFACLLFIVATKMMFYDTH